MDSLISSLTSFSNNPDIVRWGLTIAIGLLMFLVAWGVMFFVANVMDPARRRLSQLSGGDGAKGSSKFADRVAASMDGFSSSLMPKNAKETSRIRASLTQAGFRADNAIFVFFALKTVLAILLPVIVFIAQSFFPKLTTQNVMYLIFVALGIGMFGPNYVLSKMVAERQDKIRRGFSDMLDLLVVCVEAGLSFDIAIRRVSGEIGTSHPVLAEELAVLSAEVRAGVDRVKALRNFADRTGLRDIRGFVALVAQSIRFGTSIAETLRIYSEDFRDKRTQAAEELAAKVGTKMIFPLVACFFPSFFIIAIGPAILKVYEAFGM
jgi:tight adherence protein C